MALLQSPTRQRGAKKSLADASGSAGCAGMDAGATLKASNTEVATREGRGVREGGRDAPEERGYEDTEASARRGEMKAVNAAEIPRRTQEARLLLGNAVNLRQSAGLNDRHQRVLALFRCTM